MALPAARAAVTEELTSLVRSLQDDPPDDRYAPRWGRACRLCTAEAEHQSLLEGIRALGAAL